MDRERLSELAKKFLDSESESEKESNMFNSLTQDEILMLVSGEMTGDEWIAWMVERNKERNRISRSPV